jgi:two-component system chemotaxis response regulator CheY
MRFLIVDDSVAMRRILTTTLKRQGYEDVVEAGNGVEALECLSTCPVDAIITDWIMPEMDGIEFVRAVRAREDGQQQVPLLMMTTHATREHIIEAMNAGVTGYILKPFTPDTLQEKIDALVLAKQREMKPESVEATNP